MGGGPITRAARRHINTGGQLMATAAAALTFSDDPGELEAMGVRIIEETEAERLSKNENTISLKTADVDLDSIRRSLKIWGIKDDFQLAAVSVQDHGAAPPGLSDRRYRFSYFNETLSRQPDLSSQCFTGDEVPDRFTRMKGVVNSLAEMEKVIVMDTGFAALLGAFFDHRISPAHMKMLVNAGNGHILVAMVEGKTIRSLAEHHTRKLTTEAFSILIRNIVWGKISDDDIFEDGGHGAFMDGGEYPGPEGIDVWSITGPRRQKFLDLPPGFYQAAPFGSMMQTGSYGVLAAFFMRYREYAGDGAEIITRV